MLWAVWIFVLSKKLNRETQYCSLVLNIFHFILLAEIKNPLRFNVKKIELLLSLGYI